MSVHEGQPRLEAGAVLVLGSLAWAAAGGIRVAGQMLSWVWAGLDRWRLALVILPVFAFALRIAFALDQSAYMDEGTNVLTGRLLVEQHTVYAEVLNWAYGSYLWPLIAGFADALGGLLAVRVVTAALGAVMVGATILVAYRLAPSSVSEPQRRAIALVAGTLMAISPTAIAVGRFGTYDALAGGAFMLGCALLLPADEGRPRWQLPAAAALLFVAFLSKYLVAIYFPFLCIYVVCAPLVGGSRQIGMAARHLIWFVLPLSAACAAYLLIFLGPLITLLGSSMHYGDLKADDPLAVYVWSRPELWLLVIAAGLGWRRAGAGGRLVAVAGTAVIAAFQFAARPDFDLWKHAIYLCYFLGPLAALNWTRIPQDTGTWRVVSVGGVIAAIAWLMPRAEAAANDLVSFYPNLDPALSTIDRYASGSAQVLMDDTALRYYLFNKVPMDGLIGPFAFEYDNQTGIEAYRSAIYDFHFDVIVLNGGVTPQGSRIKRQLSEDIDENYDKIDSVEAGRGFTVDVYRPKLARAGRASDRPPVVYTFDDDKAVGMWGGHPEGGTLQPGRGVSRSTELTWNGHPSLQFTPEGNLLTVALQNPGPVNTVRAHVYLVGESGAPVRIGMVGFDENWSWRDDGFRWLVPPGVWTTVKWQLATAGLYQEIGLSFPRDVRVAYIGGFEIEP